MVTAECEEDHLPSSQSSLLCSPPCLSSYLHAMPSRCGPQFTRAGLPPQPPPTPASASLGHFTEVACSPIPVPGHRPGHGALAAPSPPRSLHNTRLSQGLVLNCALLLSGYGCAPHKDGSPVPCQPRPRSPPSPTLLQEELSLALLPALGLRPPSALLLQSVIAGTFSWVAGRECPMWPAACIPDTVSGSRAVLTPSL